NAGDITVQSLGSGAITLGDVIASGGDATDGSGGIGGAVMINTTGALIINDIDISGGNATNAGVGGDAGSLTIGNMYLPTFLTINGTLSANGGNADSDGIGGDGADIQII